MADRIHAGAYRLTWSDEFDGAPGTPADRRTWQAEIGGSGWGNQELQYYTDEPGNAALDGAGNLAILVRRVNPELARRRYGGCSAGCLAESIPPPRSFWPSYFLRGSGDSGRRCSSLCWG